MKRIANSPALISKTALRHSTPPGGYHQEARP